MYFFSFQLKNFGQTSVILFEYFTVVFFSLQVNAYKCNQETQLSMMIRDRNVINQTFIIIVEEIKRKNGG